MPQEDTPAVNRRRLLRRAGTVAAGLGAAGVAAAAGAEPAAAANGDPVLLGQPNTATVTTSISSDSATEPTLSVENSNSGPALRVAPTNYAAITATAPLGTVFVDRWGDITTVGDANGAAEPYITPLYSPTWATMVLPISPFRYFDSRTSAGRAAAVPGSGSFDAGGRVVAKKSSTASDLVVDFSNLFTANAADGVVAIQANLTVQGIAGNGFGYAALWDEGDWPGNSNINYSSNVPIANFTQTSLGLDLGMRIKVSSNAVVIMDVVGLVLSDWTAQLQVAGFAASGIRSPQIARGRTVVPRR